ncbi:nucleoside 2-deoxyribosyltransferase [Bacillus pakistanensis]|uniref:Nucleoside 2-deoxyribosyltransferase n=1 Tax=Rossellomorea pakistanensis TaxID=992288 RepID=A0ABS2N8B0_9BACI|nr:nucleoside 2-deoxyribosyltransferase [Bacillus pakistanensis]MBM7584091.1 nucleoside 2-deoxyribosyltransferase [Bacillus pakistanensis]
MNFYIASSFSNKHYVNELAQSLERDGHEQLYDWTKNDRATNEKNLKKIGEAEKKAIMESDVFILFLPGGKGSHIELGIALSLVKQIWIYSRDGADFHPELTTTFYYIDGVKRFTGSIQEFITEMKDHCTLTR